MRPDRATTALQIGQLNLHQEGGTSPTPTTSTYDPSSFDSYQRSKETRQRNHREQGFIVAFEE